MRAVILAAGRGSRMGSATDIKPKCLTELAGKPLLNWQLSSLKSAGLSDITVVGGYRNELLASRNYTLKLNKDWANTNMVSTLFCAGESEEDTIISYSDIVYSAEHVKKLMDCNNGFCITADTLWQKLWELRFQDPLSDAETFKSKNGILTEIGGKTNDITEIEAQYMGLLKFSASAWKKAHALFINLPEEKRNKLDMTSLLKLVMNSGETVGVVLVDGKWCEVDNQHDLNSYADKVDSPDWEHNWR